MDQRLRVAFSIVPRNLMAAAAALVVVLTGGTAPAARRANRGCCGRGQGDLALLYRRTADGALRTAAADVEFIDTLATGRHEEQILAEIEISEESGLGGRTIEDVMQACRGAVVLRG